jgi:23S rRNA (uracil1939-C5)-methyltransferase
MTALSVGDVCRISIEKLVFKGYGLGDYNGIKVFTQNALPGDIVLVEIIEKKRRFVKGRVREVITPSPYRSAPICRHFPDCGGCQLNHVPYDAQTKLKANIFNDCISQIYPALSCPIHPVSGPKDPIYYRNKMEFAFSENDTATLQLGLKKRGEFNTVIPISDCKLMSEESNDIISETQRYFQQSELTAFDSHTRTGELRLLSVRHSKADDAYMLQLVTSNPDASVYTDYFSTLCKKFPSISSTFHIFRDAKNDHSMSDIRTHISGETHIFDTIGNCRFRISPNAFFQTNSVHATTLYDTALNAAELSGSETVMDLYCGSGTIGIYMAPHAKNIIGIEENPASIEDAHYNATLNGVSNITFHEGRVKNILKFNSFSPDVVVVDPPRSGMVPKALRRIIELDAPKVVYVSCNPTTMLRDLEVFEHHGYSTTFITPVDMFPHTYHLEAVAQIVKVT